MALHHLQHIDPKIHAALCQELERQRNGIELIASENFVSRAVLEATGSILTNKYAEGLPNKRYYGGNEYIDVAERLAIERAKALFGAEHANVQPHAGSQANMAVFFALLEPGDTILGMDLAAGGHLTHGSKVNFSGKLYKAVSYGVNADGYLDMESVRAIARKEKPKLIISGFSAYPRTLDFAAFDAIAKEVGAYHLADIAHIAGIVAAGYHQNPCPYADAVTTTTHKTLRGPRGAIILCKAVHAQAIDKAVFPRMQGGPLEHVIAAKAVAFHEALQPAFKTYIKQVLANAKALATALQKEGIHLVTDGTDNHLLLVDLRSTGKGGKEIEKALEDAGIYTNKNMIPNDPRKPTDPSGIRIGTPAMTTRGMKEKEMEQIARWIATVIKHPTPETTQKVKQEVRTFLQQFPLYPGLEY
ncbi:MAG: serine hydroxymethyltransferase [Candidatus Woesearchaeota archaeon]